MMISVMEGEGRGIVGEWGVPVEGSGAEESGISWEGGGRRERFRGRPRLGER